MDYDLNHCAVWSVSQCFVSFSDHLIFVALLPIGMCSAVFVLVALCVSGGLIGTKAIAKKPDQKSGRAGLQE